MTANTQFYLDRAEQCGRDATKAMLANQRDVLLKAQAAWQAMADQSHKMTTERDRREAERLARAEEAAEAAVADAQAYEAIETAA